MADDHVWIFVGAGSRFPSGAFDRLLDAENWIAVNRLSGILTRYPKNEGAYDFATRTGAFRPKVAEHRTATFIGRFTCAAFEHYHYEEGAKDGSSSVEGGR